MGVRVARIGDPRRRYSLAIHIGAACLERTARPSSQLPISMPVPDLNALAAELAALPLAVALRASAWAYPAVEFVHLAAMGLLFGSIAVVDFRLAGVGRALPVQALLRHALPLTVVAFAATVASGALLFVAHADELVSNRALWFKLVLVGLGLANAAWFHFIPYRRMRRGAGHHDWSTRLAPPASARICAVLSLLTWLLVIGAGRLIAYV